MRTFWFLSGWFRWRDRLSFSGSIPPKFEHKLRRHYQRFGKITTTDVLDKYENLLWTGLQRHRSCQSKEMGAITYLLAVVYFSAGETVLPKSFTGTFSSVASSMFVILSVIEIFWGEVFMIRNTVKTGRSWCSAVTCRKRRAFGMKFHFMVASIFLKPYVKIIEIALADC